MDRLMDKYGVFDFIETPDGKFDYSADEFRSYCSGIMGNGVLKGEGGEFAASATGLTVTLSSGKAWLLGAFGGLDDDASFTLDPVTAGMSRICSFVTEVDAGTQQMGITILVGSQSATPADPVLIQTPSRYQQLLHKARVYDDGTVVLSDGRTYVTRPGDDVDITRIGGISFRETQPTLTDADKARARSNFDGAKLVDGYLDPYESAIPSAIVSSSRSIALSDIGKRIRAGATINGSDVTLTIPTRSTLNIPDGAWFFVKRVAPYEVTIAGEPGVTFEAAGNRMKIAERYAEIFVYLISGEVNLWGIAGNTKS